MQVTGIRFSPCLPLEKKILDRSPDLTRTILQYGVSTRKRHISTHYSCHSHARRRRRRVASSLLCFFFLGAALPVSVSHRPRHSVVVRTGVHYNIVWERTGSYTRRRRRWPVGAPVPRCHCLGQHERECGTRQSNAISPWRQVRYACKTACRHGPTTSLCALGLGQRPPRNGRRRDMRLSR